ncbi:MFS transporter [Pseudofrankia inefficax]|uniref:Drug resistance transporter, EmrB/QacA subfamily n=1 Tax=Pseudofrankia inefficax (strain DSM 45817 / CECT 9037 / DDB 130130 / EuI1c) TaxID=298654 RepID=E3IWU7_PSEI1|nr:MFS transporter [Pseudofrankia inefficax]ADP82571.1 drug resistance transporter, EmrB/QacA subfamily [Pseudofrankia inefficax]
MSDINPTAGPDPRRWLALIVVLLAQLMVMLDTTVVNVALPAIQTDLHVTQADLTWTLNGYLITYGSLLLVAGRLGDLIGRRQLFLGGIAVFTVASIGCALADSVATLVAARFVQGAGGAFASSSVLAIVVAEFTDPAERARAIGRYMLVSIGGGSLGLIVGGLLTQALNWHWIFAINVPIGIVALAGGVLLLDRRRGDGSATRPRIDVLGAVLVTAALIIGIYAIVRASDVGWGSARTLATGAVAVVLLAAFAGWEARVADPMLPPRVLRQRSLIAGSAVRAVMAAGMYGYFFFGALYLQRVLGYGAVATGAAFLPQTGVVAVMSLGLARWLTARLGPYRVLVAGMTIMLAGLVLFATGGVGTPYFPRLLIVTVMLGLGGGGAFVPLTTLALADVPPADAGLASGIVNVSMQVSAAIGLAVFGTVAAGRTATLTRAGHDPVSALVGGDRLGLLVAACCVAAGIVLATVLLRPRHAVAAVPEPPATPATPAPRVGDELAAGSGEAVR